MDFPREYFRPEVRDGFYVDGMMKRVWAASLDVLMGPFDEVCRKHNIRWYADSGTLLGAVRHKGYIPWDDDIDVVMFRDDYNRFKEVMYDEFPDGYAFLAYDSHDEVDNNHDMLTRVIDTNIRWNFDQEFLRIHYDCPVPTGLDIFPLDFIPDDPDEAEQFLNICHLVLLGVEQSKKENKNSEDEQLLQTTINGIEEQIGYKFKDNVSIEYQMIKLSEVIFGMYHRDECSRVVYMWSWAYGYGRVYEKEKFFAPVELQFENVKIPAMNDVNDYLTQEYGANYMIPDRSFPSHNYPFYKSGEKGAIELFDGDPFYFHFDSEVVNDLKEQFNKNCDSFDIKKVLFILPKYSDWKYMESYYDRLIADNKNVKVMPIPFYDCDYFRNPVKENYEFAAFPNDLPLADYRGTDIENEGYDEIVISFPYDQYNYTEMINAEFFASRLRKCTRKLTYISPFETSDSEAKYDKDQEAMRHYVVMPGVIYADEVYVQSDKMKDAYIKRLLTSWKKDCKHDKTLKDLMSQRTLIKIFSKKIKKRVN